MSHGGGGSSSEVDPNLTPLLDLVLQLLMFFIINVNFVSEQVNPDIVLPPSQSARPMGNVLEGDIYLNQKVRTQDFLDKLAPADRARLANADSIILVTGYPPKTMLEARVW